MPGVNGITHYKQNTNILYDNEQRYRNRNGIQREPRRGRGDREGESHRTTGHDNDRK